MKKIIKENKLIEILTNHSTPVCANKLGESKDTINNLRRKYKIPSPQKAGRPYNNLIII